MSGVTIGIDPGLKGGWAVIYQDRQIQAGIMPTRADGIDGPALAGILREIKITRDLKGQFPEIRCFIEKVGPMPKQGVTSTFTFGRGLGRLETVVELGGIPFRYITPQAWKKEVLAGSAKDKDAAIAFCLRRFPQVDLVPPRCRVPHDGIADAICLMEFGRRQP